VQIGVYGLIAELLAKEWRLPQQIEAGYAYLGRPSGERLFGVSSSPQRRYDCWSDLTDAVFLLKHNIGSDNRWISPRLGFLMTPPLASRECKF